MGKETISKILFHMKGNNFKDFISYELTKATSNGNIEKAAYYKNVLNTSLQRQIGSRYYVTTYNPARIIFLLPAAIEFLNHPKQYVFKSKRYRNEL